MSKVEEFKLFVKENPKLINYVKNNEMSWQKFYEIYDLYGKDNSVWNEYLKEETQQETKQETTSSNKKHINSFSDVVKLAKNMDVDKVQEGITSLQKTISLFSDLFVKESTTKSGYTPRPIYRSFED